MLLTGACGGMLIGACGGTSSRVVNGDRGGKLVDWNLPAGARRNSYLAISRDQAGVLIPTDLPGRRKT